MTCGKEFQKIFKDSKVSKDFVKKHQKITNFKQFAFLSFLPAAVGPQVY